MAKHGPSKTNKPTQNRRKATRPPVQTHPIEDESKRRTCIGCGARYLITSDNHLCPTCAVDNHTASGYGWVDVQGVQWATEMVKDAEVDGYTIVRSGEDA